MEHLSSVLAPASCAIRIPGVFDAAKVAGGLPGVLDIVRLATRVPDPLGACQMCQMCTRYTGRLP